MDIAMLLKNRSEISNICRCCLGRRGHMLPLYSARLDEMLMTVGTVVAKQGDGLPGLLCTQCALQLSKAHSFQMQCQKSESTLQMFMRIIMQEQLEESQKNQVAIDSKNIVELSIIEANGGSGDDYIEMVEFERNMIKEPLINPVKAYEMKLTYPQTANINVSTSLTQQSCMKCSEIFHSMTEYKLHLKLKHMMDHGCDVCPKSFMERKSLKRHMKTHLANKPYSCTECNKGFADMSNLKKHMRKHTGELRNVEGKPHLCSSCGQGFKWATSLYKHFKNHTGHKLLGCEFCSKQYVEARSLEIHMRSHTGEKPYKCQFCDKGFTQQCNLEKHIRVHTGEKPHVCTVCGKGFSQKSYVTIHMRIHTGEKPYSCPVCNRSFTGMNTLNAHKRIHSGVKPFDCKVCDKSFLRKEALIVHQRSHTGVKPYICTVCSKGFSSSTHLSSHMRSHSEVKPHPCTVCFKRFTTAASLKIHMNLHEQNTCGFCGEPLALNESMVEHICLHTNQTEKVSEENADNIEIVDADCLQQWDDNLNDNLNDGLNETTVETDDIINVDDPVELVLEPEWALEPTETEISDTEWTIEVYTEPHE